MGVYRQRPLLTALVVIFLLTTFTYYTGYSIQPADTLEPIERPKVPVTTSDLAVTLHQVRKDPPTIQVIVENKHPHSFITILLWDSPLDFLALPIGLFVIKPEGSDKPIAMNKTEIKRKYPPQWDLLLALRPGDRRAQDIVLEPPIVPVPELREKGKTAKISMKGRWRAVWKGDIDDVTEESLRSIEVNRGGMMGRFESDELEIDLWETDIKEQPVEEDWREGYFPEGPAPEQPPPDGPLLDEPPPEGPPPEESKLEGEVPPEEERPEEERPVEEHPPEEKYEDREDLGKVHKDLDREDNAKGEDKSGEDGKDEKEEDMKPSDKDGEKGDKEVEKPKDESKDKDEQAKETDVKKEGDKDGKKDEEKDDKKHDVKGDKKADKTRPPPPEPGRDDEHPDKDSHDDESRKEDDAKRVSG